MTISHRHAGELLADLLDAAYHATAELDRALAGIVAGSWASPRAGSLRALEALAEVRQRLDRLHVAAVGAPEKSPFIRRSLRPAPETAAAAAAAIRAQREAELREERAREQRAAEAGSRAWRRRAAGPSGGPATAGDGDRPASLVDAPAQGPSAAAGAATEADPHRPHGTGETAATGALGAPAGV